MTQTQTETVHSDTDRDTNQRAHYAPKDEIMRGYVFGVPVTALCGLKFIPTRDPERYPICEECAAIKSR